MDRSSKKIQRIVDVFQNLATVERAKVGELQREMDDLLSSQTDALEKLGESEALSGPFLALLSRSIGRNERHLQRLADERQRALERYAAATARGRSAQSLLSDAKREETRKRELRELEALIEFSEAGAAQGRGKPSRSP